ncbi:MAG: hypothetical protein UHL07_04370 [Bacteroidaceae bacterium]|nr:hypothetical protein [Bacteroidaceae bacterium]
MKQSFLIIIGLLLAVSTAQAQVTVPFDVPSPVWKGLVEPAIPQENEPCIFRNPSDSSDVLVLNFESESLRWKPIADPLEDGEYVTMERPFLIKGAEGGWTNIELWDEGEDWSGWVPTEGLVNVSMYPLCDKDLAHLFYILMWESEGETYVITALGSEREPDFYVGKFKNGYVVSPYVFSVKSNPGMKRQGIFDEVLTASESEMKNLTPAGVEYILQHAKPLKGGCYLVWYGCYDSKGQKWRGFVNTRLVESQPQ